MSPTDWNAKLTEEVEDLRRIRDELRVQSHLGKAELAERWDKLEKRWQHLEGRLKAIAEGSQESLDEIGEAAGLLVEEIRKGYRHLKDLL